MIDNYQDPRHKPLFLKGGKWNYTFIFLGHPLWYLLMVPPRYLIWRGKDNFEHVGHCLRVAPVTDPVLSFYFSRQHGSLSSKLAIIGRATNSRTKRQPNPLLLHAPSFECPLLLHDIPPCILHSTCRYAKDHDHRLPATKYPIPILTELHDRPGAGKFHLCHFSKS